MRREGSLLGPSGQGFLASKKACKEKVSRLISNDLAMVVLKVEVVEELERDWRE